LDKFEGKHYFPLKVTIPLMLTLKININFKNLIMKVPDEKYFQIPQEKFAKLNRKQLNEIDYFE